MPYRTIFISDMHLGLIESYADLVLEFLWYNRYDKLVLVGDIIDLWTMQFRPTWLPRNTEFLKYLLDSSSVKDIVYVTGNHDAGCSVLVPSIQDVLVTESYEHHTADGRTLAVIHGHQFDHVVSSSLLLSKLGTWFYNYLMLLNPIARRILKSCGYRKRWSLAAAVKSLTRGNAYKENYRYLLTDFARRGGYDGVICGHMHYPEISEGTVSYYNTGDMVSSLTILVENMDGSLELKNLGEMYGRLLQSSYRNTSGPVRNATSDDKTSTE